MPQPWNEWDWDYLWHFLLGGVANAPVVWMSAATNAPWWVPFAVVPLITFLGLIREYTQHHWEALTAHQWLEGLLWGAGGLVAALAGLPWLI